uniref:Uncharacterized protein n=1 Tax=Salix viminalis TaxID=40686 RepID=A0A6N2MMR3_SALVM
MFLPVISSSFLLKQESCLKNKSGNETVLIISLNFRIPIIIIKPRLTAHSLAFQPCIAVISKASYSLYNQITTQSILSKAARCNDSKGSQRPNISSPVSTSLDQYRPQKRRLTDDEDEAAADNGRRVGGHMAGNSTIEKPGSIQLNSF